MVGKSGHHFVIKGGRSKMSFIIDRTLAIRLGPFQHSVDLIILNKVEELILKERRLRLQISHVSYRELPPSKMVTGIRPGFRYFKIIEAYGPRDK